MGELSQSAFYREHSRAFSEAVGLPVSLHAPGEFHVDPENDGIPEFCRTMALGNMVCGFCCEEHRKLQDPSGRGPRTMKCFSGLSSSAIPVNVADRPAAFLHTGHVFLDEAEEIHVRKMERVLRRRAATTGSEPAAVAPKIMSGRQYHSGLKVLEVFARQLAAEAETLPPTAAPPAVAQAMALLRAHYERPWSLGELAAACHIHPSYLSEMFPKATGVTFTEFLAGIRVENAARFLFDPTRRISEIALSVGFRSLSQFNRVFRKVTGVSPTEFRLSRLER